MYVYLATYVKYFIALRVEENQHVKETAAIKKRWDGRVLLKYISWDLLSSRHRKWNWLENTDFEWVLCRNSWTVHGHRRAFVSGQLLITGRPGIFACCLTSLKRDLVQGAREISVSACGLVLTKQVRGRGRRLVQCSVTWVVNKNLTLCACACKT